VSDPFHSDRHAEIQRILVEQKILLDDLLETQQDIGRRLGCAPTGSGGIASDLDSLGHTMDRGFAELNSHLEQITRLVHQLVNKD
jgi:hypothetical protein